MDIFSEFGQGPASLRGQVQGVHVSMIQHAAHNACSISTMTSWLDMASVLGWVIYMCRALQLEVL